MSVAPIVLDGGTKVDRAAVGGKAWSINHMRGLGMPVPPAFCLGTEVCIETLKEGRLSSGVIKALDLGIAGLEAKLGRTFGRGPRPLFLSVRSGAARSMPGMMDTVLNVGTTDATLDILARRAGRRTAEDVGRRFADQYRRVVGSPPPTDPLEQIAGATLAVFQSWQSPRAVAYRRHHQLSDGGGTAVTVQAMVFGNLDDLSGTGVVFSRNPLSGGTEPLGEWLPRAQGEDVVSGRVTPMPLAGLRETLPEIHRQLLVAVRTLECHAKDVQDVEFTVESGQLWLLQTRTAKRSPEATVRLAVRLTEEGVIDASEALERISAEDVRSLLAPRVDPVAAQHAEVLLEGEAACPGVATGIAVSSADEAEERGGDVEVVLATATTNPDDVHGMVASVAIITELGGSTSHAAVVSRELGRPCVVGCGTGTLDSVIGKEVTVDGATGRIYSGRLRVLAPVAADDNDLAQICRWLDVSQAERLPDILEEFHSRRDPS